MKWNEPFLSALPVLEKIQSSGYEAFFVGGCVRDLVLKRNVHDVDIATSATPQQILSIFTKTVEVGIEHGTILVIYKGIGYEVTTFRAEGEYEDHRRPSEVEFVTSLIRDLERRDFTINAMALAIDGTHIDPYNGMADISTKQIKAVGAPSHRFFEDALRMLRAVRFVGQLGFTIEEETKLAIAEHARLLEFVSIERQQSEMDKLFDGSYKEKGIAELLSTNLIESVLLLKAYKNVLAEIQTYDLQLLTKDEMWVLLLLEINVDNPKEWLKAWRFSNERMKEYLSLVKTIHTYELLELKGYHLYRVGLKNALTAATIYSAINWKAIDPLCEEIKFNWNRLSIHSRSDLVITGSDLLSWIDRDPGPWVGQTLEKIEYEIIENALPNQFEQIKEWLLHGTGIH
jgi:tRNA nucleotidyltransferase (CCA-adding enzyme)